MKYLISLALLTLLALIPGCCWNGSCKKIYTPFLDTHEITPEIENKRPIYQHTIEKIEEEEQEEIILE